MDNARYGANTGNGVFEKDGRTQIATEFCEDLYVLLLSLSLFSLILQPHTEHTRTHTQNIKIQRLEYSEWWNYGSNVTSGCFNVRKVAKHFHLWRGSWN